MSSKGGSAQAATPTSSFSTPIELPTTPRTSTALGLPVESAGYWSAEYPSSREASSSRMHCQVAHSPLVTGKALTESLSLMNIADMTDHTKPPIGWQHKAFGTDIYGLHSSDLEALGISALDGDLPFPVMTLNREAISHNVDLMAQFCADHDVDMAPHAKTTMSPELVRRQLDAGAWGMTAATVAQARILREFGIDTIIIASQVLDPAGIRWICNVQQTDPGFFVATLVDSIESVQLMERLIAKVSPSSRIRVLVELGYDSGRAGARTLDQALDVARAASQTQSLVLTGVEGFEGMMPGGSVAARRISVDSYLRSARVFTEICAAENLFENNSTQAPLPLVTFGGSAFHDLVVRELAGRWATGNGVRIVLRSGCYITHDHGLYADTSPWADGPRTLRAAAEVWGVVLSLPEPYPSRAGRSSASVVATWVPTQAFPQYCGDAERAPISRLGNCPSLHSTISTLTSICRQISMCVSVISWAAESRTRARLSTSGH